MVFLMEEQDECSINDVNTIDFSWGKICSPILGHIQRGMGSLDEEGRRRGCATTAGLTKPGLVSYKVMLQDEV